jgi:hypothetical protein
MKIPGKEKIRAKLESVPHMVFFKQAPHWFTTFDWQQRGKHASDEFEKGWCFLSRASAVAFMRMYTFVKRPYRIVSLEEATRLRIALALGANM